MPRKTSVEKVTKKRLHFFEKKCQTLKRKLERRKKREQRLRNQLKWFRICLDRTVKKLDPHCNMMSLQNYIGVDCRHDIDHDISDTEDLSEQGSEYSDTTTRTQYRGGTLHDGNYDEKKIESSKSINNDVDSLSLYQAIHLLSSYRHQFGSLFYPTCKSIKQVFKLDAQTKPAHNQLRLQPIINDHYCTAENKWPKKFRFSSQDMILGIGEMDFSFMLSMVSSIGGKNIFSTSYHNGFKWSCTKSLTDNVNKLKLLSNQSHIAHDVDATRLMQTLPPVMYVFTMSFFCYCSVRLRSLRFFLPFFVVVCFLGLR